MNSSIHSQRGRSLIGPIVGVLIVLVIVGGLIYYFNTNNRSGSVRAAWYSLKETSEDASTTTKVKIALALSKHASAFDISVDTKRGTVTLTGQVPSDEIKVVAGVIAQDTSGVKLLNNNLVIDPSARPNPETSRLGARVADLEIKTIIQDAIAKNPELKDKPIGLEVKERVVTLSGAVEGGAQKNLAQQTAWGVQGVHSVINNITVTNPQASPESADEKLSRRVEFELYSTKAFSLNSLQIGAQDGTVTLSGSVASRAERLLAEKVAQTVGGVRKVENNLTVMGESGKE